MELTLGIGVGTPIDILLGIRLLFGDFIPTLFGVSLALTIEISLLIPPKMAWLLPDFPLAGPPTFDELRENTFIFGDTVSFFFSPLTLFCSAKIPLLLNFLWGRSPIESPIEA